MPAIGDAEIPSLNGTLSGSSASPGGLSFRPRLPPPDSLTVLSTGLGGRLSAPTHTKVGAVQAWHARAACWRIVRTIACRPFPRVGLKCSVNPILSMKPCPARRTDSGAKPE